MHLIDIFKVWFKPPSIFGQTNIESLSIQKTSYYSKNIVSKDWQESFVCNSWFISFSYPIYVLSLDFLDFKLIFNFLVFLVESLVKSKSILQVEIVLNFFPGDQSTAEKYKQFVQKLTKASVPQFWQYLEKARNSAFYLLTSIIWQYWCTMDNEYWCKVMRL